jgi:hypothetical protein
MKQDLKQRHFADVEQELLAALDSISVEDFRHCFQQWEWRCNCGIQSWGGGGSALKVTEVSNLCEYCK